MRNGHFENDKITLEKTAIVEEELNTIDENSIAITNYDIGKNRSEVVRKILNDVPSWIVRRGISVIVSIIALFFISTFFISYSDSITAEVEINAETPPANIVARTSGKIKLLIKDKAKVKKGQYLGLIENPANTEDLFYILENIEDIKNQTYRNDTIGNYKIRKNLELGSIQESYLNFLNGIQDYNNYLKLDPEEKQIANLENKLKLYGGLKNQIIVEKKIMTKEKYLVEQKYQRHNKLWKKEVISKAEYENIRLEYLNFNRLYEGIISESINNSIQVTELHRAINLLNIRKQEQLTIKKESVIASFKLFKNRLLQLEEDYLLKAPIDGEVSFFNVWADNQNITEADEVMTVVPDSGNIFGFAKTPIRGSGNIKKNQKVNIKFHAYPATEYGRVFANVQSISLLSKGDFYNIRIKLPNGLNTTYKKKLKFRPGMKGTAKIITKDKKLIERIFNSFQELFDKMKN